MKHYSKPRHAEKKQKFLAFCASDFAPYLPTCCPKESLNEPLKDTSERFQPSDSTGVLEVYRWRFVEVKQCEEQGLATLI